MTTNRIRTLLWGVGMTLAVTLAGCSKENRTSGPGYVVHEIGTLGVQITMPRNAKVTELRGVWAVKSGDLTAYIAAGSLPAPKTVQAAAAQYQNPEILAGEKLTNGAIYLHYRIRLPPHRGRGPYTMDFLRVILARGTGHVRCEVKLRIATPKRKDATPTPTETARLARICKSLKKI